MSYRKVDKTEALRVLDAGGRITNTPTGAWGWARQVCFSGDGLSGAVENAVEKTYGTEDKWRECLTGDRGSPDFYVLREPAPKASPLPKGFVKFTTLVDDALYVRAERVYAVEENSQGTAVMAYGDFLLVKESVDEVLAILKKELG